ncbi:9488_t:CDS:2 [Funneliformis caledonium]|uniref:9488_t:CDS:1 n=1 Tax=Funneliformis caledonium TaxID=1117310 RepID=A0A9N8WB83_9GLOM|nr:9488_t:CDS:2 [Funneliformis caledonium]
MSFAGFSKRSQSTSSNQIRQNFKTKSPEINLSKYQNERDDRDLDKERDDDDCSLKSYDQPQPINENDDFNNSKDIETEYDEQDHLSSDLKTSRKYEHDMDDIVPMQTNKKIVVGNHNEHYIVSVKFLEKLNGQNKVIWKNQLKQDKKLDEIMKILSKLQCEDGLSSAFLIYLKDILKVTLKSILRDILKILKNICLEKMRHCQIAIAKDIRLALFKIFPEVPEIKANAGIKIIEWKRNPWVAKAYTSLWKVDNTGLLMINTIIMKAMSREDKEVCLKPLIIAFTLANCSIVLNPHSKDIQCTEKAIKK